MSSITLNAVTKRFGDLTAVDQLDLEIENGAFVALLGPSGCGKTTTMNMIAGIETLTSGEILFDGDRLSGVRIQDRNIGFVFQNYAIFTHLSVYKNLAYGLEVRRLPRAEIDRKVKAMAERMSITHRLNESAASLSVNEMQKLAIGRSAVTEPRIFLLDEPLSNLDAGFRAYMRAELKVLQHSFGQTMVYVTHDQVEAMSLANKIAIIDKGKLMQYGAPLDVYNDPDNRFVANFVGSPSMNLLDGHLEQVGNDAVLRLAEGSEFPLPPTVVAAFAKEAGAKEGVLGIRPQDIYVGPARAEDDRSISAEVDVIERVGPKRQLHLRIGKHDLRAIDDAAEVRPGERITVSVKASGCLAFSATDGRRLRATAGGARG